MITLSDHAVLRAVQRNITLEEIIFVIEYGRKCHRSGVIFHQMWKNCMPDDLPGSHRLRRLTGTTVVTNSAINVVVTLYRNEAAFKRDRSKQKHRAYH